MPINDDQELPIKDILVKNFWRYAKAVLAVWLITAFGSLFRGEITPIDQVLFYLTGAVIIAARLGSGPSGLYSVLTVLCFNFFFIPPLYSFDVSDHSYWLTFAVMIGTSLVIANQATRLKRQTLEAESEQLRAILLSSVSHDLRTPLASITGASSTIVTDLDHLSRDTVRDLSRSINSEAERLSRIVANLLEVTRLESNPVQLNKEPYFVEELIGAVLERLKPILANHKVMPISDSDLPLVMADGVLIEQLLVNLVENAVHYTSKGSTITIAAEVEDNGVLISVSDNGPGIPAGDEKKIFNKFYSIAHKNTHRGSGLGLAICAGIIKAHHGEIWFEPNKGGGSRFCFTLPLAEVVTEAPRKVVNG
jgi:two-component system sensor histidine kinase KdpD